MECEHLSFLWISVCDDRIIPSLFLVDREGKTVFNLHEDGDQELYSRLAGLIDEKARIKGSN